MSGGRAWTTIAAAGSQTCGVTTASVAYCWGENSAGQIGDGASGGASNRSAPVLVAGGHLWATVAVGDQHACGVTTSGVVRCWGANSAGQSGDGREPTAVVNAPVPVVGGASWSSISAGTSHTCAIDTDARLFCWGSNTSGQIGDGTVTDRVTPADVSTGMSWAKVAAAYLHTCAVTSTGEAYS